MKKTLIFGSLIMSLLIFSGCGTEDNDKLKIKNSPANDIQQELIINDDITPTTVAESDLNVYENESYGFTLVFPETWKNYTTKEEVTTFGKTVYFGLDDQKSGLFAVTALTKDKWLEIKNEEGPKPTYLGENENYVFGWSPAQYTANDEMNERMKEVSSIAQTFKVME